MANVRAAQKKIPVQSKLSLCNIKTRQSAILNITGMALLAEKIRKKREKNAAVDEIKVFVQKKAYLTQLFNEIEKHLKEGLDVVKSLEENKVINRWGQYYRLNPKYINYKTNPNNQ